MTKQSSQPNEYNGYKVVPGPSYLECLPDQDQWLKFKNLIKEPKASDMMELWHEKAEAAQGVPLRSDFNFGELAKFGTHLSLYKLTETNRWLTTFCGTTVVQKFGIELTGKHLDEYADKNSLEFWMENVGYICEQAAPFIEYYSLNLVDKDFEHCVDINLPLRSGNRDFPDMFFAMMDFGSSYSSANRLE